MSFLQAWFTAPQAPWLPDVVLQRWALQAAWALVLGAFTFVLASRFRPAWRAGAAAAVAAWCLWPGPASPSYWLGLAFQSPSLMGVALCLVWAWRSKSPKPVAGPVSRALSWPGIVLASAGILFGWLLLGDMLAWWPVSVYAWGFGSGALALACALALLLWVLDGAGLAGQRLTLSFAAVLLVFTLTRLPSGNLWDALLDPWLWLILQASGLLALLRRVPGWWRASPATRA
ncbi:MAG: hypothetical protein Q8O85_00780 [Rhodoferax sp.]|uniref:hypothetical protein n=1 Tax=Rhodoferax sp. TaxID=50421 RepID=UPI0008D541B7|nr:hypothetical protein [Rhodoferax sp.]MDP2677241.1 hypothetical protein [Rhodoferax sp.]OGB53217.1 MAG: hypothetical protein A2503_07965 [Burkholderiales bacterium RIFOXYD12_FULL_59_19]